VLSGLATAGGVFIACDGHNLPVAMMLPLASHFAQAERFAAQARAPVPVCKRLWRQIVRAKIAAQAALLIELRGTDFGLRALVARVRSGDPSNVEARAARRYWPQLFADLDFRRHRENEDQNILLNYGYAVLRAIIARAICTAGLHPSLGIHHHNRYNAFCLADDLMEPFRPTVDHAVAEYLAAHDEPYGLEPAVKQQIIAELTGRYSMDGDQRTIFDVAARMAASLADIFLGNGEKLSLPKFDCFPRS
jgi:CRISPR-associated protein Cas1